MLNILYFTTPKCHVCKFTGPSIKSAAAYYHTAIEEINCDDSKNDSLIAKHKVFEAPTIILLKDSYEVFRTTGMKSLESLLQDLLQFYE